MTRLLFLLPLGALALSSCTSADFAFFPQLKAKNRIAKPGDPEATDAVAQSGEAYLAEIPPAPVSTDRGGSDVPTSETIPTYSPNKKLTLEELTEAKPSTPGSPSTTSTTTSAAEGESGGVHWFGRPNEGNTSAIPVGPIKNP